MELKSRYIGYVLSDEAEKLKRIQESEIASSTHQRSGALLSRRFYNVQSSGMNARFTLEHPIYERFLDMKNLCRGKNIFKNSKRKIHNKHIYRMYGILACRLMNGFTDEVAMSIRDKFRNL